MFVVKRCSRKTDWFNVALQTVIFVSWYTVFWGIKKSDLGFVQGDVEKLVAIGTVGAAVLVFYIYLVFTQVLTIMSFHATIGLTPRKAVVFPGVTPQPKV